MQRFNKRWCHFILSACYTHFSCSNVIQNTPNPQFTSGHGLYVSECLHDWTDIWLACVQQALTFWIVFLCTSRLPSSAEQPVLQSLPVTGPPGSSHALPAPSVRLTQRSVTVTIKTVPVSALELLFPVDIYMMNEVLLAGAVHLLGDLCRMFKRTPSAFCFYCIWLFFNV